MPRIPLYSFQPQATQSMNVRADPGMFDRQAAATQRLGNAVADLGQVAADTAFKLQRAQNFKTTSTLQTDMEDEWTQFQATLNPSSDETQWATQWQNRLDARVAKALPKGAGPILRDQIEAQTREFKIRTTGDVSQQAKAVGVEKAKLAGTTRVNALWRNGQPEAAEAKLHEMAGLGLILPEEIPGMVQKGESRMEQQQATNLIVNDPIAATDALEEKTPGGNWKNFKKLDEDDRLTLLNHARTQTTQLQSAAYGELIDGLANGAVRTPEELSVLVDRKIITAKQAKSYTNAYRHGGYNTSPDAIGQLFTDITKYDPQADPDQTERAKLLGRIATTGFPQNVQSEANQLLGKKADPLNPLNQAVAKDAFEGIDQRFKLGIYGKYETRKMITTGPMAGQWTTEVNGKVYEQAMITKRRIEDATRKFIQDNPKATAEQVNQFVSDAQMGETVKSGRQAVLTGLGLADGADRATEDAKAKKARLDAILNKK